MGYAGTLGGGTTNTVYRSPVNQTFEIISDSGFSAYDERASDHSRFTSIPRIPAINASGIGRNSGEPHARKRHRHDCGTGDQPASRSVLAGRDREQ